MQPKNRSGRVMHKTNNSIEKRKYTLLISHLLTIVSTKPKIYYIMNRILPLMGGLLLCATLGLSQTFSDDFEGYNAGDYLGVESAEWTTWSGVTGGAIDIQIDTMNAHSGTNSTYYSSVSATGGPIDMVLDFNGEHNTGGFNYKNWFYVEAGKGAYFNFQGESTIGEVWTMNCQMDENGVLVLSGPSNNPKLETTFTHDTWFELEIDVNLNTNDWELLLDGVSQGFMQNDNFTVASLNMYPVNASNNQAGYWVDDVEYTLTPYTLPALNAGISYLDPNAPLVGMNAKPRVQVRNLGTDVLTSFDVEVQYNGTTITETVTGVTIPSLETYDVSFSESFSVVAGELPVTATVMNPNGGTDGDAADDSKTININPVTPADGRMVFVEEGTGTWCQWCPRGAVVMDDMAEKFHGFFAGAAVHNGASDPMVDEYYDDNLAVGGYPGGFVDRGADIDPLAFEAEFIQRIQIPPTVSLVNGAEYNSSTGELKVSATATFLQDVSAGNYRLGIVMAEDSVTGTTSGYNQVNVYSGGGNGPMGGYENLPNPVPASMMVYNHVARGIAPSYAGTSDGYQMPVTSGHSYTVSVTFQTDPTWDSDQFHIISFIRGEANRVDNAMSVSLDEAIANGFQVGIEEDAAYLNGPDAQFQLYPNPATDMAEVVVQLDGSSKVSMQIFNSVGQQIAGKDYGFLNGANRIPVQTSGMAAGIYTVSLTIDGMVSTRRLVVN